jgi:hypothetical protein
MIMDKFFIEEKTVLRIFRSVYDDSIRVVSKSNDETNLVLDSLTSGELMSLVKLKRSIKRR